MQPSKAALINLYTIFIAYAGQLHIYRFLHAYLIVHFAKQNIQLRDIDYVIVNKSSACASIFEV